MTFDHQEVQSALREARAYIINLHPHKVTEEEKLRIEQIFRDIIDLRGQPNWGGALIELEQITKVIKTRNL